MSRRLLYAPDSYGGFLSSAEAVDAFVRLGAKVGIHVTGHPMADGGEGSLAALHWHGLVELGTLEVQGAYGATTQASGGRLEDGGFVEVAQAIGLQRRSEPLQASSFGVGEMLQAMDAEKVFVGLGGSATVDAGVGALTALGMQMLDAKDKPIENPVAGQLSAVRRIVGSPPLVGTEFALVADVTAPFLHAPARFGPQKGLKADEVAATTDAFRFFADALARWCVETKIPPLQIECPGGGAAGGLGFALATVLEASIIPGASWFAHRTRLDEAIETSDVVVTGEGRLDASSFEGKVVGAVTDLARQSGKEAAALVGMDDTANPPAFYVELCGSPVESERLKSFQRAVRRLLSVFAT